MHRKPKNFLRYYKKREKTAVPHPCAVHTAFLHSRCDLCTMGTAVSFYQSSRFRAVPTPLSCGVLPIPVPSPPPHYAFAGGLRLAVIPIVPMGKSGVLLPGRRNHSGHPAALPAVSSAAAVFMFMVMLFLAAASPIGISPITAAGHGSPPSSISAAVIGTAAAAIPPASVAASVTITAAAVAAAASAAAVSPAAAAAKQEQQYDTVHISLHMMYLWYHMPDSSKPCRTLPVFPSRFCIAS